MSKFKWSWSNLFRTKIRQEDTNIYPAFMGYGRTVSAPFSQTTLDAIKDGYNTNAFVYLLVKRCTEKIGQIPFYLYKIKKDERKTWHEYMQLSRYGVTKETALELKIMRRKAIEGPVEDSPLSKLLRAPNGTQSWEGFSGSLYGYKLLTGEGNILIFKNDTGRPVSMVLLPKRFLHINPAGNPFDINGWTLKLTGKEISIEKNDLINWKFPSYDFDPYTLAHLRGLSPIEVAAFQVQASNDANTRRKIMNKNQGSAGFFFNKAWAGQEPDPAKAGPIRESINDLANNPNRAGAIETTFGGDWSYIQFGMDAGQLKLIEQSNLDFNTLCNVLNVPPGLFLPNQTYENQKECKKDFIYNNISPACASLRGELNKILIPAFLLDEERYAIDYDVIGLPELAVDLKTQIEAVQKADFLTQDEKRIACNYEPMQTPEYQTAWMDFGKQPIARAFEGGTNLDTEMQILDNG